MKRPRQRHNVLECPIGDELLLYARDLDTGYSLNVSARAIWELCDGRRTVSVISEILTERFGGSFEEVLADVRTALRAMSEQGLVRLQEAAEGDGERVEGS